MKINVHTYNSTVQLDRTLVHYHPRPMVGSTVSNLLHRQWQWTLIECTLAQIIDADLDSIAYRI